MATNKAIIFLNSKVLIKSLPAVIPHLHPTTKGTTATAVMPFGFFLPALDSLDLVDLVD